MFSFEYCRITCFEEHLQTVAFIRCYFNTINLKQSGFCTTYSFKILDSERKHKNNIKNRESQKNNNINNNNPYIYNAYVMFYYKIPWFYQYFKNKNLYFLNSYSVHAARILDLSVKSSQTRNETLLQL